MVEKFKVQLTIKDCPHGGKPRWSQIWEPIPGFEYIALECSKSRCYEGDWDCRSEYFKNTAAGRVAVIIDWNRKVDKRKEKMEDKDI